MIDYHLLTLQNPWWGDPRAIEDDQKIQEFHSSRVPWQPAPILNLPLKAGAINIVFGPRQTGKSTAVKLLVQELLAARTTKPETILYFNCDALDRHQDVIDLVVRFQESLGEGKKLGEHFLLLDEVSSVPDWPYAIKWLADAGRLRQAKIILTGSSSVSLKKSGELLPGRRGGGRDITLLPVSYATYLSLVERDVPEGSFTTFHQLVRLEEHFAKHRVLVEKAWHTFLMTGGFLRTIDTFLKKESTESIVELYLGTVRSELAKAGRKELPARQILRKIISSLTSETSYANVAEEAELGSKNTAAEYLNFFRDSFLMTEMMFFSIPEKKILMKKNKKYYPADPFLFWIFQAFVSGSREIEQLIRPYRTAPLASQLAESFVASEVYKQGLEVYFYHNRHELDFYLPALELGIEVKYKEKITTADLQGLAPARRKLLVSKSTLERRGDILIVPVHLFGCMDLAHFRLP